MLTSEWKKREKERKKERKKEEKSKLRSDFKFEKENTISIHRRRVYQQHIAMQAGRRPGR